MVKSHETVRKQVTRIVVNRPIEGHGIHAGRTISLEEIKHIFLMNGWSPYRSTWRKAVNSWAYFGYCTIDEELGLVRFHCNEYGEYLNLDRHCNPEILQGGRA